MRGEFGLIFWLHLFIVVLVLSSPFLMGWRLVGIGVGLFYAQLLVFGGCVLVPIQFPEREQSIRHPYRLDGESFYHYYLTKLGFRFDRRRLNMFIDFVLPGILFGIAILWRA
jgi:hypothetical protein